MSGTVFALIVALYGTMEGFNTKPHLYAVFFDRKACEAAAVHFEQQMADGKYKRPVALCVERLSASPLPTS